MEKLVLKEYFLEQIYKPNLLELTTCIIMKMKCCFLSRIVLMVSIMFSGQWIKAQDLELQENWWQPH